MENLTLLDDLNRRYTAYRAKLDEQFMDVTNCIMKFKESSLKEDNKVMKVQDSLMEINIGDPQNHR